MKRVALIDNFNHIDYFRKYVFEDASIEDILNATGGNTGNVAFVHAIEKIIANSMTRINWGWDEEVVQKNFDHIVICAANQIGMHTDLKVWGDKIQSFGLPITVIGIGAQSDNIEVYPQIPSGTLHFLEQVSKYSECNVNISVRGQYTSEVLENIQYKSCVTGCPSLFISKNKYLGQRISNRKNKIDKVAVAAGNIWHKKSAFLEDTLCDIVDRYSGSYIVQHPSSMIKIMFNELDNIDKNRISLFLEKYNNRFDFNTMLEWMNKNAILFIDVANWMNFLRMHDGVIGPRYHGVALGIQKGIPGIVVTIDSRTKELCQETGIKSIHIDNVKDKNSSELVSLIRWSEEEGIYFDQNRKSKARTMIEFLEKNKLVPSEHLKNLAE